MTENQFFSMSTELFDTSSNSSNPLKYDSLYSLGGLATSGAASATALFATFTNTNSAGGPGTNSLFTPISSVSSSSSAGGNVSVTNTSGSNVMLTNAITIPRSNNPNQNHNPYQEELQHHPTSSPFFSHLLHHQQQQQQQQQQNLQQQPQQQTHITSIMSSPTGDLQQQQNQQNAGLLSTSLSDYSDYALDALDSSLSPSLLQDVSLSAAANSQNLNSGQNSSAIASPFFNQDPSSPLSQNAGSLGSNGASLAGSSGNSNSLHMSTATDITGVVTFLNSTANADDSSSLLYDSNLAPNSMWSDIGSAITTKNEPFSIEDNYIFQLDKSDGNNGGFGVFEADIANLEDITNLEDFLPSSGSHDEGTHSFHLLSPSLHAAAQAGTPSPGIGPPIELLQHQHQQQQQQQQQQQEQQHMQQFTHLQSLQNSNSASNNDSNANSSNRNSIQIQQQQQQNHQSSSSPYEIYHSTPNKQQQQQMQQQQQQRQNNNFSPGSLPSHSPLQINSITPPPPHANRSQYQQSQVKPTNMQQLLKKGFSISPDRNNSSALLGHSVPANHGILMTSNALSPSSGSSGFGGSNGATLNSTSPNAPVISVNSARKQFYQANDGNTISRLSSSAPTHLGPADIWMRREPRQHLLSTSSLAEAESFSSLSTASVLSPDGHDYSQDDDDDLSTDYNSEHYDDSSSDNGSDNEDDTTTLHGRSNSNGSNQLSSSKGKERFFWQYNVQAKGPKGKRLVFQSKLEDPHVLNEVTDPVFSPNCSVRGIKVYKHSGKARKGDGNDLTPNPRKLHNIGKELDRLSRTINGMTPVSEQPYNSRSKSRKEKNKLASRACRLKKKAQHEANKIKLYGLEIEHKRLINAISDIKQNLAFKYRQQTVGENSEDVDQQIERIYKHAIGGLAIAGNSTEFVNQILEKVKSGEVNGGLEELRNT